MCDRRSENHLVCEQVANEHDDVHVALGWLLPALLPADLQEDDILGDRRLSLDCVEQRAWSQRAVTNRRDVEVAAGVEGRGGQQQHVRQSRARQHGWGTKLRADLIPGLGFDVVRLIERQQVEKWLL